MDSSDCLLEQLGSLATSVGNRLRPMAALAYACIIRDVRCRLDGTNMARADKEYQKLPDTACRALPIVSFWVAGLAKVQFQFSLAAIC